MRAQCPFRLRYGRRRRVGRDEAVCFLPRVEALLECGQAGLRAPLAAAEGVGASETVDTGDGRGAATVAARDANAQLLPDEKTRAGLLRQSSVGLAFGGRHSHIDETTAFSPRAPFKECAYPICPF